MTRQRVHLAGISILGLSMAFSTAASAQPAPAAVPGTPPAPVAVQGITPDQSYVLGADDVVELEVLGRSDFRTRARVGADGKILVPYLGAVEASNRTVSALAEELSKALEAGGYFMKPVLRAEVVSFASRYVTVLGAVSGPGLIPMNRPYRVSEIIARVGGIRADGADYVIIRPENGAEKRIYMKAMATGGADQDPFVAPGDKIYVPPAEVFYISGQVRGPGTMPISSDMTFAMAIAKAGGLTDLGSDKRLKVTRGGKKLDRVDLNAKVEPGDIIDVGERLF